MSSKKTSHASAPDSSQTMERKLRPVYDCLDFGNYKKALQESEKILKKYKESSAAKALKALSLVRLGRTDEASVLIKQIHETKPSEENTLQVLTICYKELNKLDKIAELYENAVAQVTDNEEYLSHLFMAHVRLGNYKKQQQAAVALHKLKPDNHPYYYWTIMSIIMQASETDASLAQSMLLPLAEKMAKKQRPNRSSTEFNAEVTLLLIILEKQGKLSEALDVMNGELGNHIMIDGVFKDAKVAELLRKMGNIPKSNLAYKALIDKSPDNWQFYADYFSTLFTLLDSPLNSATQSDLDSSQSVDAAVDFIRTVIDRNASLQHPQRGPYLAQLELFQQLLNRGSNKDVYYIKLRELLIEYCKQFGSKSCCFKDVRNYFEAVLSIESDQPLNTRTEQPIIECLRQSIGLAHTCDLNAEEISHYTDRKSMQQHILVLQFERLAGRHHLSPEQTSKLAATLYRRYKHSAANVEQDAPPTEVKACDTYLLLAVHSCMDAFEESCDSVFVVQALSWLEEGKLISPANHQISLLLIYIYSQFGAFGPIPQILSHMDIKHILLDSLGYMFSSPASSFGHFSTASQIYGNSLKYFTSADREVSDSLIACYRYGTFSKVEEFVNYKRRIRDSMQYAFVLSEQHILDLILETKSHESTSQVVIGMDSIPESDLFNWDGLRDNRDLPISESWLPRSKMFSKSQQDRSLAEEKGWLKMRYLQVRLLATAVLLAEGSAATTNSTAHLSELMQQLIRQYKDHVELCQLVLQTPYKATRFTTHPTRLGSKLGHRQCSIISCLAELVLQLGALSSRHATVGTNDVNQHLQLLTSQVKDLDAPLSYRLFNSCVVNFNLVAEFIESLVSLTELLSFSTILTGACWKLCAPFRQALNSRKKKKSASDTLSLEDAVVLLESVKKLISTLRDLADRCLSEAQILADLGLEHNMHQLGIRVEQDDTHTAVMKTLLLSYEISATEVRDVINNKRLFLDSLS